mmetsp:Transcript_114521/g.262773  ORF Transcript_114521/g.262773 Transcript_114521/m.262773 type:complete len:265 (-) Transcript_114521:174-968(-)
MPAGEAEIGTVASGRQVHAAVGESFALQPRPDGFHPFPEGTLEQSIHFEASTRLQQAEVTALRVAKLLRPPLCSDSGAGLSLGQLLPSRGEGLDRAARELRLACQVGDLALIDRCLRQNAQASSFDQDGFAAVHIAADGGHPEAIRRLLRRRACMVDIRTAMGHTAVHIATVRGHSDCVAALLSFGAQVDSVDEEGFTPLHMASACGDAALVHLLTRASASLTSTTSEGKTALDLACDAGFSGTVAQLLTAPDSGFSNLEVRFR